MTAAIEDLPEIIAKALHVAPAQVTSTLRMGDIPEWDSVAHLGLVVDIESAYGVAFSAEEIMDLTSVKAFSDRLARAR